MNRKCQIVVALMFLTLIASGCTKLPQLDLFEKKAQSPNATAEMMFINGDFKGSLKEFRRIYRSSLIEQERNQALYGIACSQMIMAITDEEFIESIRNLKRWDVAKGGAPFVENHHMLVLALAQQAELTQKKKKKLNKIERKKNTMIANQKKKISQMSTTLEKLRKQLTELETLDESFREMRKPL